MKKMIFTFLLISLFSLSFLKAQTIIFPDEKFEEVLLSANPYINIAKDINRNSITIDTDGDGKIQISEALQVHYLDVGYRDIDSLEGIENFTNLEELFCNNNTIANLDISNNINLSYLNCSSNQLLNLDTSKNTPLRTLDCSINQLTTLDISNNINLYYLNCSSNQLSNLDTSKNTLLSTLECNINQLTTLDISNNHTLFGIHCENNLLETLFLKNGIVDFFILLEGNPNLKFICCNENQERFIQEQLDNANIKNCVVSSYCSFTPGGVFYTIKGEAKVDTNANGCDENDVAYPYLKFSITDEYTTTISSNEIGVYSIPVQKGTYTVTPVLGNLSYFTVSPASITVTFPNDISPKIQNFCITLKEIHNDLDIYIIPNVAIPGLETTYKIIYRNKGNTTLSGDISFSYPVTEMNFISANPIQSSNSNGLLEWKFSNLKPFETKEILTTLKVIAPPVVNVNDILTLSSAITFSGQDQTPQDNSFTLKQNVRGSYDPNDKTCLEGDKITPEMVGNYLNYLIRFENIGNYPAKNIVVKDMIDTSKFDISTLQITDASHSVVTKISEENKVEFIFENINLPYTEPDKHGYIAFKIKTLPTLAVGDVIKNQADIFFDYNLPVTTNEAITSIDATLSTEDIKTNSSKVSIYPNPVKNILHFNSKESIKKVEIFDLNGRVVRTSLPSDNKIDLSSLSKGVYFINIYSDKGNKTNTKFIKE